MSNLFTDIWNKILEVTGIQKEALSETDMVAALDQVAECTGLNWKGSIVDLLKLLKMDSSRSAREALAKEWGCPADQMGGDSSRMNVWLHTEAIKRISANGGNLDALGHKVAQE